MNTVARLFSNEVRNAVRNRWLPIYTVAFFIITELLIRFSGGPSRALLSLMNLVLIFIPLICLAFGMTHLYSAREYIEVMLSQPVKRRTLFAGMFTGFALPMVAGFVIGTGLPFALHPDPDLGTTPILVMLLSGSFLTLIFLAIAFWLAFRFDDRVKGLGASLVLWLFLTLFYDGIILFIANALSRYPLEKPMLALILLNPIDLSRVFLLLNLDASALMGYTGAVFEQFFGSVFGVMLVVLALSVWTIVPLWRGLRMFETKDF